ncbi:hypothetical protein DERP_002888 [Dermatophagoides pteronyssinus]|uniref:Uncharacterized protein n=1 Tax=Dermatophagoides pteronyssinus TaxID=6956 RepID=A0ABQ8JW00_DERPT|nr:hypothetical protein DERP_002888 [Dermatophagoides pteronyssinus]
MEQRALEQRAMERPTMEQRAMEQQRGLDQRRHQLNQINHNSVEATCKRQINKFHLPWLPVNEVAAGSCFGSVPGSLDFNPCSHKTLHTIKIAVGTQKKLTSSDRLTAEAPVLTKPAYGTALAAATNNQLAQSNNNESSYIEQMHKIDEQTYRRYE